MYRYSIRIASLVCNSSAAAAEIDSHVRPDYYVPGLADGDGGGDGNYGSRFSHWLRWLFSRL